MKINRMLNLTLPVERADGSMVYVHSTPIPEDVFNANWLLITKTVSGLYMEKLLPSVASRVGYRAMLDVATKLGMTEQAQNEFFSHVWRLTNVMLPSEKGWIPTPFEVVMASGQGLDKEDVEEVKNFLCFFTSASWVHPRKELGTMLYPELENSGAQFVSLNSTEYASSLRTLTQAESTGAPETPVQVPH